MPINKNALLRYRILDSCFSDFHHRYDIDELVDKVNDAFMDMYGKTVSLRQIRADIAYMKDRVSYDAPIKKYPYEGKKCYYRYSDPDFTIFNSDLNVEEAMELRSTIEMLGRFRGIPGNGWLEEVISKLEYRFGVKANRGNVVSFEQNEQLKGLENLSTIIDAAVNRQPLLLQYRSYSGNENTATIHPYHVKEFNNRWFLFGLEESKHGNRIANRALDRIEKISPSDVAFIPYPPREERIRIAAYLDTKLSEIDHQVTLLTSKRNAYIRLKKSIINRAVTKGLNSDAAMKDSGVDWIGMIPEHWEVKRMKDVVEYNLKVLKENTPQETLIKYVEISDVSCTNGIDNIQLLKFGDAPSRARRITQKGDIIVSTVRTYLKAIAKIIEEDIIVSTGFTVLHPFKCDGTYMSYYVLTDTFIDQVIKYSKGTSYPAINSSDLVRISIPYPPLSEQHAIAVYLDEKCSKIDRIISNLDKQISKYGDLKRSLIDEVITGKRVV